MNSKTPENIEPQETLPTTDVPKEADASSNAVEAAQPQTASCEAEAADPSVTPHENSSSDTMEVPTEGKNVSEVSVSVSVDVTVTVSETVKASEKVEAKEDKAPVETSADASVEQSENVPVAVDTVEEKKLPILNLTTSELKDRLYCLAQKRSVRIGVALIGVLLVALFSFRWYLFDRPVPFKVEASDISVMVSDGDSARRVMDKLTQNGLDVNPSTLRLAARFADIDLRRIHAGLYKFEAGLSPVAILEKIAEGALADQQLRIPDGAPIWEVMKLIRSHEGIKQTTADKSEIEIARLLGLDSPSLEGWLAPDTYHFSSGTTDLTILRVAVKQQQDRLQKVWNDRAEDAQVKTLYDALILASIIEKETGHSADRTLISSVFNNRLRIKMPLQTDPTVIYGIGEKFDGNLRRRDLNKVTPYNTYKIQGLPPTPIATPSPASLEAAMHPAKTKFLYFVSRGDGTSEFSTNLKDHNRAVRKYILKRR